MVTMRSGLVLRLLPPTLLDVAGAAWLVCCDFGVRVDVMNFIACSTPPASLDVCLYTPTHAMICSHTAGDVMIVADVGYFERFFRSVAHSD